MEINKNQNIANNKMLVTHTISNKNDLYAEITNYGAKIIRLFVPNRNGKMDDVVLGFDNLDEYITKEEYFGAVCGRFANRIKDANFTLDGINYPLIANNGHNALHGGEEAFNTCVWDVKTVSDNCIVLHYLSADGEEGYPGNLDCTVTYDITDSNELRIHYEATTDKPTIVGLTQHSYFNLKGAGNGTIRDHVLQINADYYTVLDDSFAPSGEIRPVENTAFDFRSPILINDRIDHKDYVPGKGIDNNWCLRKNQAGQLVNAGYIYEPTSGRKMEVFTTQPGMQIYTANWVEKQVAKGGMTYDMQDAICMETQGFPNSPNIAHFPSPIIRPDEKYDEWCIYKFSVD
jgi:aldose 1-epimerase